MVMFSHFGGKSTSAVDFVLEVFPSQRLLLCRSSLTLVVGLFVWLTKILLS